MATWAIKQYREFSCKAATVVSIMSSKETEFAAQQTVHSSYHHIFTLQAPRFSPVRLALDSEPVKRINPLLYHKTTDRRVYETAMARFPDHDDVLLFNEDGEITQSTIANFIINLDGILYTPMVQSGLLTGTHRNFLLESGTIQKRVITVETLACLPPLDIYLINSVQGMYPVILEGIIAKYPHSNRYPHVDETAQSKPENHWYSRRNERRGNPPVLSPDQYRGTATTRWSQCGRNVDPLGQFSGH